MATSPGTTVTSILYKTEFYRGFEFTGQIQTIDDVKRLINKSTMGKIKQPYTIEIEDEGEYVQLNDIFLQHKRPWCEQESQNGTEPNAKRIKLKINEIEADRSTSRIYEFAV